MSTPEQAEFLADALAGLTQSQKRVSGKYLWDEKGSVLFDTICGTADYYPTAREITLLSRHAPAIADMVGADACLVEYGSGASHKIRILLDALTQPRAYIAIDISREFLHAACARIAAAYPPISVLPVCADYTHPISLPAAPGSGPTLGFYPGTTIGNFNPAGVIDFLTRARATLGPSWFLVGVDPNIDPATLARAYSDEAGLMARLHTNLLHRIARELGGDIDPANFRHDIQIHAAPARVEAHLMAQRAAHYTLAGQPISFSAGQTIHTDTSHKYAPGEFQALAEKAGWRALQCWVDEAGLYSLHLLRCAETAR